MTSPHPQTEAGRHLVAAWRRLLAPLVATLVALAILIGLGLWQLERKTWKEGLLAAIASRAHGPAVAVPPRAEWASWSQAVGEYQHVTLAGTFLGREFPVQGLTEGSGGSGAVLGFFIFAPLRLADGSIVFVNRGFVPADLRDPATRAASPSSGTAAVSGLLRAPENRGMFVPLDDPGRNTWFAREPAVMAAAAGLGEVAPFYVDADASPNPGGWPIGGRTQMTLPNDHLQYAFTWFGLGAALLGVFGVFAVRRIRGET